MAGRRLTRPRTRVYDCNYNLGENYYRSALDGLDRKYGTLPAETIEPPRRQERPFSMGNLESLLEERKLNADALNREMKEEMESVSRISRARAREIPSTDSSFENAFHSRRDEVKKRFSEKMLDAVGINGTALEEESASLRHRRAARRLQEEEKPLKLPMSKWSALTDHPEDGIDEWATRSRAQMSRARLADIENEMEEMASRGAQRERRLANLREFLSDSAEEQQNTASMRMRKTVVTTTTEKRVV